MGMGNYTVRRAMPADAELLSNLARKVFTDTYGALNDPKDMALYLEKSFSPQVQNEELQNPDVHTLLLAAGETTVGFAQIRRCEPPSSVAGKNPMHLHRIYVEHAHHGTGASQALMKACLETAREVGFQTLWLAVWAKNHRAQSFYRKFEFEPVGTAIFHLGNDPHDDLILARPI